MYLCEASHHNLFTEHISLCSPSCPAMTGKLAHSLRLGPARRVSRYLRLEFSGHLTPEAHSGARPPHAACQRLCCGL